MDKKRSIIFSVLSLGAIFVLLIFTAPSDAQTKRYVGQVKEIVSDLPISEFDLPEEKEEVAKTEINATVLPGDISEDVFYDVVRVVDGDTLKIMKDGEEVTLRLIGMNTPETVDPRTTVQCFGHEASDKAKELLTGKKVRLETDPSQDTLDKYGRTLGYIYLENGTMYNKWMIKHGYAYEYTYRSAYKYQKEFKLAQNYAEENELGLWSPETCAGKK